MGSETTAQHASKVARNVADRVARLEVLFQKFAGSVSKTVTELQSQSSNLDELIGAVIEVVGVESVTEAVLDGRKRRLKAAADDLRADVEGRLKAGTLKPADAISEKGFLVCSVADGAGNLIEEAKVAIAVPNMLKTFKDAALGQKVGHKLTTPDGRILTVLEVYEEVEASVQDVAKEASDSDEAAPPEAKPTSPPATGSTEAP